MVVVVEEEVREKREELSQDRSKACGDCEDVDGGDEGLRMLVVDDSPVDRKIVEMLLKRSCAAAPGATFHVVSVDSGKKAMEVLGLNQEKTECTVVNEQKIDIILTDYCMPEMTGYDLLKAIKDCSCLKSLPVVIMSSENDPQRITSCRAMGAEDFILKPLRMHDIHRLKDYARPSGVTPKSGTKRKLPPDLIADSNNSERDRRPCLTGVAVA